MRETRSLPAAYFDALAVGERFESRGRTVTEADLVMFSALTGDWHPQHADARWAEGSAFGERIAHGMLVLSYALGLVQLDPARVVALRGLDSVKLRLPVRIGDTIRVRGRVAALAPVDAAVGLVRVALRIANQDERTVATGSLAVLWRRADRPRPAPVVEELEEFDEAVPFP